MDLSEELKNKGRLETFQTTALLRSTEILRRILETRGNLLSLRPQWKTTSEKLVQNNNIGIGNCARKWSYMHKPDSVLRNEIQTDHPISARWPDLLIINNNNKKKKERTCRTVDFAAPADHRVKLKESEKKDMCLDFEKELKKNKTIMKHESNEERTRGSGNQWENRNPPDNSIDEID